MAVKVKLTNTEISGESKVADNMIVSGTEDVTIEMDKVKIKDSAQLLNDLTEAQIEELPQDEFSVKSVLKRNLPNVFTGTVANILSEIVGRKL